MGRRKEEKKFNMRSSTR